uniref:Transposase (putative) YhgA-like domain-containing protein n=1 Tax=Eubacterium plexicaudatum ASF492 TaxID=1235802 RepID=N2AZ11_9FIRM
MIYIDLLITKNQTDISINNEIGCIFRGHNIVEYKDPVDSLNIDVFFKTEGYACLYKSYGKTVDAIAENDITMTFVRENKPSGLFAYFQEHGYQVSNPFKGVYYITGNILFPAQIIVTKELKPKLHVWLRALSGKLEKQDLQNLLEHMRQLTGKMDREYAEAVLEVAFRANIQILKEWMGDVSMSKELLEIVKPIIEPQILLREQTALEKGIQEGIEKGIEKGIVKGAVDILKDFGRKDAEIKTIIMQKYSLTDKDANEYL